MFIFSTNKSKFLTQLYNMFLRRLPSQHGEVSVMFQSQTPTNQSHNFQWVPDTKTEILLRYIKEELKNVKAQNVDICICRRPVTRPVSLSLKDDEETAMLRNLYYRIRQPAQDTKREWNIIPRTTSSIKQHK